MQSSRVRASARKLRPSPSMLVALLALVVAMSGSAYAAVTINGKNIKKGTVTSKQIKDKTVTGKDVKDASLTGADLAAGTIPTIPSIPGPEPIGTATTAADYNVPLLTPSDIPGMSVNYTVPAGATKIVASFSGDCDVSSTIDDQHADVRILVDGVDASPTGYLHFCGPGDNDGPANTGSAGKVTYTSGKVTKVMTVSPGAHTVKVQGLQILAVSAVLDNMTLTVQSGS